MFHIVMCPLCASAVAEEQHKIRGHPGKFSALCAGLCAQNFKSVLVPMASQTRHMHPC